jgi:homoserine kinase
MSNPGELGALRLRLPATSANLGPGFDAVAVALDFFLEIEAEPAPQFSVTASGRDAERCAVLEDNLILETYKQIMRTNKRAIVPLAIRMVNGIPLGMGCGSSAAARLAAIALAAHFGGLRWNTAQVLEEAYKLEGHPDNVAACWLGGFVTAVCEGTKVHVARVDPPPGWRAIIAMPDEPLSTSKARAVLPASFPLEDVVANLQSVAVMGLAFAQARADLLRLAMRDRIHQPYRAAIMGEHGILGVALSGAGPAVLVIVDGEESLPDASIAVQNRMRAELLVCRFSDVGAFQTIENM